MNSRIIPAILMILFSINSLGARIINNKKTGNFQSQKKFIDDDDDVPYTINFYQTKLNNFEFDSSETFPLRYLVADSYYKPGGPILFYCGNEGGIFGFWDNFGFLKKNLAEHFNALVIFAEHRFFGQSYPQIPTDQNYKYLSSEQALEDYIHLIQNFKENNPQYKNSKVIGFGGSYGGMLSAWARMKYPNVFAGSVASSAPILLFGKPNEEFNRIVTETYAYYNPKCPVLIRAGFNVLYQIEQNTTQADIDLLNTIFTGSQIQTSDDVVNLDQNTLETAFEASSQYNYPFSSSFSGFNFPPLPAKIACDSINLETDVSDRVQLLYVLKNATNVAYNWDSQNETFKIKIPENLSNGWSYMTCTEMVMPIYQDGINDMFNPSPWNYSSYQENCVQSFQTDVRPYYIFDTYGGRNPLEDFKAFTNIFFINGLFDPYRSGCPSEAFNNHTQVFEAVSAHHEDLFSPTPNDPPSITKAREIEIQLIEKWINE